MNGRATLAVVTLLAEIAFAAACGSPGSPSKTASPGTSTPTATGTAPGSGGPPTAADCATIKRIAATIVSRLAPLQTQPRSKAATELTAYLTELRTAENHLTSPRAKASLNSVIMALEKSRDASESQATRMVLDAISGLGMVCP